jgi:hypothetical protein
MNDFERRFRLRKISEKAYKENSEYRREWTQKMNKNPKWDTPENMIKLLEKYGYEIPEKLH